MLGLCRRYRALPEPGALLDQPVWLLRLHNIVDAARDEDSLRGVDEVDLQDDPVLALAGLMEPIIG